MNLWKATNNKISPVPIEMIITERLRPYEKAGKEETMKFRDVKKLDMIEQTALEFGATMSGIEYGTLLHMNLDETSLRLIFIYELEKSKMLDQRREQEEFNRHLRSTKVEKY